MEENDEMIGTYLELAFCIEDQFLPPYAIL